MEHKDFLPRRARKEARRVGDPCRIPCRVRKEVWLEPRRVRALELEKKKTTPPLFKKKSKISGEGVICAPSAKHGKAPIILKAVKHQKY